MMVNLKHEDVKAYVGFDGVVTPLAFRRQTKKRRWIEAGVSMAGGAPNLLLMIMFFVLVFST